MRARRTPNGLGYPAAYQPSRSNRRSQVPIVATITINVDPEIQIGSFTLAWHGLMIAVGLLCGTWLAGRFASERGLERDRLLDLVLVLVLGGMIGSRAFYLALNDAGALLRPSDWLGSNGFAFFGALILGPAAAALLIWRRRLSLRFLDALAAGFPLGMAVGRIGDVISGEHYGSATTVPWGFKYLNPNSEVPGNELAYHQGAFYEIVVALAMLAILWPLRDRFVRPLTFFWTTVAFYALGRFVIFFWRSDTDDSLAGINLAQVTSLAILFVALGGIWVARRRRDAGDWPSGAPTSEPAADRG